MCFITVIEVSIAQTLNSAQTTSGNFETQTKPVYPSGRTIMSDMKVYNLEMYKQYLSGRKKQRTGIIVTGAGGGVAIIGAILSIIPDAGRTQISIGGIQVAENNGDNSSLRKAGVVMAVAGAATLSVGLPIMISGGKKKKQIFQDFKNKHYPIQQPSSYFQMNVYPNRAGIAYVF